MKARISLLLSFIAFSSAFAPTSRSKLGTTSRPLKRHAIATAADQGAVSPQEAAASLRVQRLDESDLTAAAELCVQCFFGEARFSPLKASHLRQLCKEQRADLAAKLDKPDVSSLFCLRTAADEAGEFVGVVEVSLSPAFVFLGPGEAQSERGRPLLSNLAVDPRYRGRGLGRALTEACENEAVTWGFSEIVLQVDEDNSGARAFYESVGYREVFQDRSARRYNADGLWLSSERTARCTLCKDLTSLVESRKSQADLLVEALLKAWAGLEGALGSLIDGLRK
jgi:ribosomal protein S18 acetylase RimI-like enzyme